MTFWWCAAVIISSFVIFAVLVLRVSCRRPVLKGFFHINTINLWSKRFDAMFVITCDVTYFLWPQRRCRTDAHATGIMLRGLISQLSPTIYRIYNRPVAAAGDWVIIQQRWRTHRCRVMSGTTLPLPRRKMMWLRVFSTFTPSVISHSMSSTRWSEVSASLATCSSFSSSPSLSRSLTRYCRIISCVRGSQALCEYALFWICVA